jgi:hypothetical protein
VALALARGGSIVPIVVAGMVFGFGTAAAFTPLTVAATAGVPPDRAGLAAGVLNTVRQTSGAAGITMPAFGRPRRVRKSAEGRAGGADTA